ncbi:F-box LRR-repeat 13 isoform X2 [Labeo rohita]|uniref:F-box LRR-repeat 13 isoform X2 n=1 Tax=Labeo rohita TaxID=84645 RepID=A0A498NX97_LABRO|nr:F-box LRR-repeat 13 isoform X2 [Labeo rohita]RXN36511.1 F-box LRR-repeat 13 isoform X2 [Labeo rohita]
MLHFKDFYLFILLFILHLNKALLAGLCVSCPEDPLHFIEEKILLILEDQDFEICWHTFIDKDKQISSLAGGIVYDIFGNPEDSLCLSHLLEKAYSCYRTSLTKMCFRGWKSYISKKKMKAARLVERMEEAEMYHKQRRIKLAFIKWTAWVQFHKQRQNDALRKLQKVQDSVHCRNTITAWRRVVQDAKRAKEYFKVLVSRCRVLTVISILDSPYLSDVAFKTIADVISLTKIQIQGNNRMTDSSLKALCRSSLTLSEVQISDCPRMTDASLKSLGSLTKLCNLNISGCIKCSSLTHLSVCFCENLTDNGFECLNSCTSLNSLDITGCKIHDKGLAALGTNHSLRKLTATECVFITDNGIKMTDTAVKYLTRIGHLLKELDVSGCPLLTDRTPSFLLCSCVQLRSISMLYCKNISNLRTCPFKPPYCGWCKCCCRVVAMDGQSAQHNCKSVATLLLYLGKSTQQGNNPNEITRTVNNIIAHPTYNRNGYDNDIALLHLSSPVTFNDYIQPVCLAAQNSNFPSGTKGWVTGWGQIGVGIFLPPPGILQEVEVEVYDNNRCNNRCRGAITNNMICAGTQQGGRGPWRGDSGGPLVHKKSSQWVQSGVVNWSEGCAQPDIPAVYARVSVYQQWITGHTGQNPPGFVAFI